MTGLGRDPYFEHQRCPAECLGFERIEFVVSGERGRLRPYEDEDFSGVPGERWWEAWQQAKWWEKDKWWEKKSPTDSSQRFLGLKRQDLSWLERLYATYEVEVLGTSMRKESRTWSSSDASPITSPHPVQHVERRGEEDPVRVIRSGGPFLVYHDLLSAGLSSAPPPETGGSSFANGGGWGDDFGPSESYDPDSRPDSLVLATLLTCFETNYPRWIN